jgi:hypothetical protein
VVGVANVITGGIYVLGLLFIITGLGLAIADNSDNAALIALYGVMVYVLYFVLGLYFLYVLVSGFDYLKKTMTRK